MLPFGKANMIGIFGGSFDPIHHGHIHLALALAERHALEEIWFVPAKESPFKQGKAQTSFFHRGAMVKLAVKEIPHCHVLDIENQLPTPSYTVNTLEFLQRKEAKPFALLLGEDAAFSLPHWHQPERICAMARLLVGARKTELPLETLRSYPLIYERVCEGWTPIPHMDITATEIRQRLAKGLYCKHWVPSSVVDFIRKHRIY